MKYFLDDFMEFAESRSGIAEGKILNVSEHTDVEDTYCELSNVMLARGKKDVLDTYYKCMQGYLTLVGRHSYCCSWREHDNYAEPENDKDFWEFATARGKRAECDLFYTDTVWNMSRAFFRVRMELICAKQEDLLNRYVREFDIYVNLLAANAYAEGWKECKAFYTYSGVPDAKMLLVG